MKVIWISVVLLAMVLAAPTALAHPAAPVRPAAATVTATYTLYGNATAGWGFTPSTVSEPGPTITASVGENITLQLYSEDAPTSHTWFLSLDGASGPSAGEPAAGAFSSSTAPETYSFIVPNKVGTYTYKCGIHPNTMSGSFVIVAAPNYVLYGNSVQGWGLTPSSIHNPGPNLAATQGQALEIAFYAADNITHQFFVSYDGALTPSAGEPVSANFSSAEVPVFLNFTASQSGNYTYYCRIHPSTMRGSISIASTASPPPSYTIYAAIIVVVALVAIAVAIFIRRRPRAPPAQPPMSPPGPG